MRLVSATDVAIAFAIRANRLVIREQVGRFGDVFWAVSDDAGLIEVHTTQASLQARLADIQHRAA